MVFNIFEYIVINNEFLVNLGTISTMLNIFLKRQLSTITKPQIKVHIDETNMKPKDAWLRMSYTDMTN